MIYFDIGHLSTKVKLKCHFVVTLIRVKPLNFVLTFRGRPRQHVEIQAQSQLLVLFKRWFSMQSAPFDISLRSD